MPVFNNILAGAAGQSGGAADYKIERSLRFNDADSAYLSKNTSAGNRKTWTFSTWCKQATPGQAGILLNAQNGTTQGFASNFWILFYAGTIVVGDGSVDYLNTNKLRDPSAWYHIVVACDTTQGSPSDRLKIYINGVESTYTGDARSSIVQNSNTAINSTYLHRIGDSGSYHAFFDGYLADTQLVDGQALSPTDFGEFDANGVWQPKEFTGSYNHSSGTVYSASSSGMSDPELMFDGNTSTNPVSLTADGTVYTMLSGVSIPCSTSLRINANANSLQVSVNGGAYTSAASVNSTWLSLSVPSGNTLQSLTFKDTAGGGYGVRALEVDGTVLVDGFVGANGFHLDFSDNSSNAALGTDSSGNNNTWTVNNLVALGDVSTSAITNVGSATGTVYYSDNNNNAYDPANLTVFSSGQHSTTASNMRHVKIADLGTGSIALTHVSGNNFYITGSNTTTNTNSSPLVHGTTGAYTINSSFPYAYARIYAGGGGQITYNATVTGPTVPVLTTTNNNNYSSLSVGDSNAAGVSITAINSSGPSITVDGGSWSNGDVFTVFNNSDSVLDSPTNYEADSGNNGGNYCTMNPLLHIRCATLSNGNLDVTGGSYTDNGYGTIAVPSGKWYAEATVTGGGGASNIMLGVKDVDQTGSTDFGAVSRGYAYRNDAKRINSDLVTATYGATYTKGDVIGIALDLDAGTITFYKNGSSQGVAYTGISSSYSYHFCSFTRTTSDKLSWNFGQRSFAYTPPSNHLAVCTQNLDDPLIADGSTAFDAKLYTGNNSTQTISGLGFSPDLVWMKARNNTHWHALVDSVRGIDKVLFSQDNWAEDSSTTGSDLVSFNSDGFTLGPVDVTNSINGSGRSIVAWAWDAGSSTASNTDGTITSQVRANPTAGFSIVSYTGNGSSSATVGHGLNASLGLVIIKNREDAWDWIVKHKDLSSGKYVRLNATGEEYPGSSAQNGGIANLTSSSTFGFIQGVSTVNQVNKSGEDHIAYCFAPVAGYSAFGSYEGNGSSNGTFVYTGFKPRWLMIKAADSTGASSNFNSWLILDTARDSHNASNNTLWANQSADEDKRGNGSTAVGSSVDVDILSNGFKLRQGNDETNGSGITHIYAAFAENPFKTARAR